MLLLFAQVQPLDKALEAAKAADRPVNDWIGAEKLEAEMRRVSFYMVPKEGKKNGSSFKVARTADGWFTVWEN